MTDRSGICHKCGRHGYLIPLHGDRGGPLMCPLCAGAWNAEHTRRRKFGRILAKAAKLYYENGGRYDYAKMIILGTQRAENDHDGWPATERPAIRLQFDLLSPNRLEIDQPTRFISSYEAGWLSG